MRPRLRSETLAVLCGVAVAVVAAGGGGCSGPRELTFEAPRRIAWLPVAIASGIGWSADGTSLWTTIGGRAYGVDVVTGKPIAAAPPNDEPLVEDGDALRIGRRTVTVSITRDRARLEIAEPGRPTRAVELRPRIHRVSGLFVFTSASPDERRLVVTLSGWTSYETDGAQELWLIDLDAARASFVMTGQTPLIPLPDREVQSLRGVWSGSRLFFAGDSPFGIERIDAAAATHETVWKGPIGDFDPGNGGYSLALSHSRRWLVLSGPREERGTSRVEVVSTDGGRRASTGVLSGWHRDAVWHPRRDVLAWSSFDRGKRAAVWVWYLRPRS